MKIVNNEEVKRKNKEIKDNLDSLKEQIKEKSQKKHEERCLDKSFFETSLKIMDNSAAETKEKRKKYKVDKKKEDKTDFRYVAPGLFREKVQAFAFLRDTVAVSGDITHQGEDIFLRLIKVYFKAAKKGLGDF